MSLDFELSLYKKKCGNLKRLKRIRDVSGLHYRFFPVVFVVNRGVKWVESALLNVALMRFAIRFCC